MAEFAIGRAAAGRGGGGDRGRGAKKRYSLASMSSRRSLLEGLGRSTGSDLGAASASARSKRSSLASGGGVAAGSQRSLVFEGFGSATDVAVAQVDPFVSLYDSSQPLSLLCYPSSTSAAARVPPPPRLKARCPSVADWSVVTPRSFLATARRRSSALLADAIAEAGLSSMDAWDYTMELECLNGPDGSCVVSDAHTVFAYPYHAPIPLFNPHRPRSLG